MSVREELKDILEVVSSYYEAEENFTIEQVDDLTDISNYFIWQDILSQGNLSDDFIKAYGHTFEVIIGDGYWKTVDGDMIKFKDLEHSHISNIYYYSILMDRPKNTFNLARYVIMKYHNGVLLDYKPKLSFELDKLKKKKLLKIQKDNEEMYDIIMFGRKVGEVARY